MKITYKGDYALKAILELSHSHGSGEVTPLSDISRRQNVPLQYLEQIMLILKGAGYVDSRRGAGGGFFLTRDPAGITLGEIIRQIEGPVEPIACVRAGADGCGEEESCAFREVWVQVTDAISEIIDSVTFADIMRRDRELREEKTGLMYHI